jgi:hypothetical protein
MTFKNRLYNSWDRKIIYLAIIEVIPLYRKNHNSDVVHYFVIIFTGDCYVANRYIKHSIYINHFIYKTEQYILQLNITPCQL